MQTDCQEIEEVCIEENPVDFTVAVGTTDPTCGNTDGEIALTVTGASGE